MRALSPVPIPRAAASDASMCSAAVAASFSGRSPKVEFMLSSCLGEINSNGKRARKLSSPKRDSTGGVYSIDSPRNSHLPEGVPKPPDRKSVVEGKRVDL